MELVHYILRLGEWRFWPAGRLFHCQGCRRAWNIDKQMCVSLALQKKRKMGHYFNSRPFLRANRRSAESDSVFALRQVSFLIGYFLAYFLATRENFLTFYSLFVFFNNSPHPHFSRKKLKCSS